jgi:general secretion pathway protein G
MRHSYFDRPFGWAQDRLSTNGLASPSFLRPPEAPIALLMQWLTRRGRVGEQSGFTLLELMTIIVIIGILVTLAVPSYQQSVIKAREAVLKQDLFTLRDVLDQYRADQGKYPSTLTDLVKVGYLRTIPVDPFTRSGSTWQETMESTEGGIFDIHSGSTLVATNGTPYNEW